MTSSSHPQSAGASALAPGVAGSLGFPFAWAVCQVGAEPAVKAEVARLQPGYRPAFMRPGLVTWKCEPRFFPQDEWPTVFVRAYGASLGTARSVAETLDRVSALLPQWGSGSLRVHVFSRDGHKPGEVPHQDADGTAQAEAIAQQIVAAASDGLLRVGPAQRAGEWVLDVVLPPVVAAAGVDAAVSLSAEPWLIGVHRHGPAHSSHAGGRPLLSLPSEAPSRAWLKLEEGLAFSGLPVSAGDVAVEIGSAPGGASWALLSRGLRVIGVDPGSMDARVLASPRFAFVQTTLGDLRREQLPSRVDWLLLDVNLAPQVALHQVRRIVSTLRSSLRGALLTLKLNNWGLAEQVPRFVAQVRAMGFDEVRATQLPSNRQEICVAARRRNRQ